MKGLDVRDHEMMTASSLSAYYLKVSNARSALVLLAGAGRSEFDKLNITIDNEIDPEVIIVGDIRDKFEVWVMMMTTDHVLVQLSQQACTYTH